MLTETVRARLPLLAQAQSQKPVIADRNFVQLDALLCARFLDRDLSAPPATPAEGDCYLVKPTAGGDWTTQDNQIAFFAGGAWKFYPPFAGLSAFVADESKLVVFDGAAWLDYAALLALQNVPLLGVNAAADATNKLNVKSAALLFDNIGAGVQAKLNKTASGDTASLLYQTGYSGRAEIGLCGDDDFHFKVSSDGARWNDSIVLARSTGVATINQGLAAGAVPFGGGSGAIAQDAAALSWDDSAKTLTINGSGVTPPAPPSNTGLHMAGTSSAARGVIIDSIASTVQLSGRRANTSYAAPTALAFGDQIVAFVGQGYDGADYRNGGNFSFFADENWVAGANSGTRLDVRLVGNGSTVTVSTHSFFGDGRLQSLGAFVDQSYSCQRPANGFSLTVADTCGALILDPGGTLAGGAITLPAHPKDGQLCRIASTQAVGALTLSPSAGQSVSGPLTALAANGSAQYLYRAANTTWYRCG
ncbi:MAG: DUF2793 domain-containing protein [Rhizomicrobium sp.]